jgi:hypothetical protein
LWYLPWGQLLFLVSGIFPEKSFGGRDPSIGLTGVQREKKKIFKWVIPIP